MSWAFETDCCAACVGSILYVHNLTFSWIIDRILCTSFFRCFEMVRPLFCFHATWYCMGLAGKKRNKKNTEHKRMHSWVNWARQGLTHTHARRTPHTLYEEKKTIDGPSMCTVVSALGRESDSVNLFCRHRAMKCAVRVRSALAPEPVVALIVHNLSGFFEIWLTFLWWPFRNYPAVLFCCRKTTNCRHIPTDGDPWISSESLVHSQTHCGNTRMQPQSKRWLCGLFHCSSRVLEVIASFRILLPSRPVGMMEYFCRHLISQGWRRFLAILFQRRHIFN